MASEEDIFKIERITNDKITKSWGIFSSYKKVKTFIVDTYLKYNKDVYDDLLMMVNPNDPNERIIDPSKIIINNLDMLTDYKNRITINVCSFTYYDSESKYHTSILLGLNKRIFLLNNYNIDKDAKFKKPELLVYDFNKSERPNNDDNKLIEPFYFFIKDKGLFDFCYTEKNRGIETYKHIKCNKNSVESILDFNDPNTPQINFMSNPIISNSYINDKYIGSLSFDDDNINLFNMYSTPPQPIFSYIDIIKKESNFEYTVKQSDKDDINIINKIFSLSYILNNNSPIINITIKLNDIDYLYNIKGNEIVKTTPISPQLKQIYNINRTYIPLNNNSTYISALITLALKFTDLKDSTKTKTSIKEILEIGNIYNFSLENIKQLCSYFNNCDKEENFIKIINDIVNTNSDLFNFNIVETYNIIIDDVYYNVYTKFGDNYEKVEIQDNDSIFTIKINDSMTNIDINKLLEKKQITKDIESNTYYYYINNDPNNSVKVIENNNDIRAKTEIENINNYLVINFEIFNESEEIINTNLRFTNIMKTLHFNDKILIPNFAVLFVGNNLDSGYYVTLQYYNNNWYIYEHKNRYEVNYINDNHNFNINNSQIVSIIYKSYNGTEESVYKNLIDNVLFDKFDSDYTINYYLNPQYELLKYKEAYIHKNYKVSEIVKVINKSKDANETEEQKYEVKSSEFLPARELFISIDKEINENTIINLHSPNFIDDFIKTSFNIKKTNIELTNTLNVLEST
jgi:hypothetical protein